MLKLAVVVILSFAVISFAKGEEVLRLQVSEKPRMDREMTIFGSSSEEGFLSFYFNEDIGATFWSFSPESSFTIIPQEFYLPSGENKVILKQGEKETEIEFYIEEGPP